MVYLVIIIITAIGLSPGGSGYFTCIHVYNNTDIFLYVTWYSVSICFSPDFLNHICRSKRDQRSWSKWRSYTYCRYVIQWLALGMKLQLVGQLLNTDIAYKLCICTGVLISLYSDHEGNKVLFLSELREFPSVPCRKKKKRNFMTARVSMLLKSCGSLTCFRACFLSWSG